MDHDLKVPHGTTNWFAMVGKVMMEAAGQATLAPDLHICLLERYTDGVEISPGLVSGLRFEIIGGKPRFSLGARADEKGDITVEVTTAASRTLNTLYAADPLFQAALVELHGNGQLRIEGDMARLGDWFSVVHDRIVDRTA